MDKMTFSGLRKLQGLISILFLLLVTITYCQDDIPEHSDDGYWYYNTTHYCVNRNREVNTNEYTIRDVPSCCYRADAKFACCMDGPPRPSDPSQIHCRCHPSVSCGTGAGRPDPRQPYGGRPSIIYYYLPYPYYPPPWARGAGSPGGGEPGSDRRDPPRQRYTHEPLLPSDSLCRNSYRVLSSSPVTDECEYGGVANITVVSSGVVTCNAVYTMATVDGSFKSTFLTSAQCRRAAALAIAGSSSIRLDLNIGRRRYPLERSMFQTFEGANGASFIDVNDRYTDLLEAVGRCQYQICPYNERTMSNVINRQNCRVVSWGTHDSATFSTEGLYQVDVYVVNNGCRDPDPRGVSNTFCVRTRNGGNLYCQGDSGAPVFCRATSNNEWILMGVLANERSCDGSPEGKVIPYPG